MKLIISTDIDKLSYHLVNDHHHVFFFFWREKDCGISQETVKVHVKVERWSHVRYRSSLRTSCKVGSFAEALGADRRPRSDAANAFAAAHAKSAAHLFRHAASTQPLSNTGAPWALCCAREVKKLAVSADHRPPTSPARTTSLARPPSPASSGYVRSFRLLATLSAAPGLVAGTCPGSPVATQCADQCHVNRELGASEQGQPFCDDF